MKDLTPLATAAMTTALAREMRAILDGPDFPLRWEMLCILARKMDELDGGRS